MFGIGKAKKSTASNDYQKNLDNMLKKYMVVTNVDKLNPGDGSGSVSVILAGNRGITAKVDLVESSKELEAENNATPITASLITAHISLNGSESKEVEVAKNFSVGDFEKKSFSEKLENNKLDEKYEPLEMIAALAVRAALPDIKKKEKNYSAAKIFAHKNTKTY